MVAAPGEASEVLETALAKTRLCLTAESVGLMQRALSTTVAYTKERRQFGKALAEFQVLQHYLVDMSNAYEQARSLLYAAVSAAETGWTPQARARIARAHDAAAKAGALIGKKAVQIHGGMGMSEEMPLGRMLRRQKAVGLLFPASA